MNIFLWHEQTICRASGVKVFFFGLGYGKGRRDRYQQNSLRLCDCHGPFNDYGGLARGPARKL